MDNENIIEHLTGKSGSLKKLPSWIRNLLIIFTIGTPTTTYLYAQKLVAFLAKPGIELIVAPLEKKITILESVVLDSYRYSKKQDKMMTKFLNSVGQSRLVKEAESEMRDEMAIDSVRRLLNKKPDIFTQK